MKTILIIGDSWGVPNYEGLPGDPPETHIEFLLRAKGYKVYNCSYNGSSNEHTIIKARQFLNGEPTVLEPTHIKNETLNSPYEVGVPKVIDQSAKIDVILWFHTEFFRTEKYDYVNESIEDNTILGAHNDYKFVGKFFKEFPDAKTIVIGGQSPVVTDILHYYIKPDYMIEDWRTEILGKEIPKVHTLTKPEQWIGPSKKSKQYKLEWLDKTQLVLNEMARSSDFPDNCHPGSGPHKVLAERLHKVMSQMFKTDTL